MATVGRRLGHKPRRGERNAYCQYCWALFPMDRLVRLRNGLWACVDNDAIGRDSVALDEANANAANKYGDYYERGHVDAP